MSRVEVAAPGVAALVARLLTGPHTIDDAYITFRYARDLATGLGLVYNPGEWVLGTTAPLWALMLAGGYRLGATDLAWLATLLSAACDAASAILLAHVALHLGCTRLAAALVGLVWAFNPMSIAFATGGMETSLFVLLTLCALVLMTVPRPRPGNLVTAAVVAGASTLVRPEGALLATTVIGWTLYTRRRDLAMVAAAAAAPMAAAAIAIWQWYGSVVPHSVTAKQVAYASVGPLDNLAALLIAAGLPGWSTYLLATMPNWAWLPVAAVGLAGLVALGWRGLASQADPRAWQPVALFGLLYIAFYTAVGLRGVRMFTWYLVPVEPLYLVAAAAGLARARPVAMAWLAASLLGWQAVAIDWHQPLLPLGESLLREQSMLAIGDELGRTLPPGATVASPEIGALGYASNVRVLDTVGLVSPMALRYYPLPSEQLVTDNAIPAALIADQQPDAVVTLDAYVQRTLLVDPTFQRDYRLIQRLPTEVWHSRELLVFRRADVAAR